MFELFRRHRRRRIVRLHPFSDALWSQATVELPVLFGLDANELVRLRDLATIFAWEKKFFGVHGLEVTDYMRAIVAAQACLPILNLDLDLYLGWYTVILYPETFVARHEFHDDIGVVHEGIGELDGESVEGGPVVLSWAESAPRPPDESDGTNVVVHEFAHKLDYLTGVTNGLPPLHRDMSVEAWSKAFTTAFDEFTEMTDSEDEPPFDDYAAEDPGEFFAVMSEYFFEDPERLNDFFPAVYDQLKRYYRQDPLGGSVPHERAEEDDTMNLVEQARRLASELSANAAEDAQLRRLSDRTWSKLREGGFVRALQPARWGGGEAHIVEFVDALIELSRASPSAGWVAGVIGVHPWQLALFADAAQQDMWRSDAATMHSSSYNPTGKAQRADGGYRLSGRWSFSSGCDHCRGVVLGATTGMVDVNGTPAPDFRSFLLMQGQYRIDDNWFVAGLSGTGSKDIVVDDAFVPDYRTQSHLDYAFNRPLPGRIENDGPLYRLPWSVVFNMALAASVIGGARGFIDTWVEQQKSRRLAAGLRAADDPLTQQRLGEAMWYVDATHDQMRRDAETLWQMALDREDASMQQRAAMRWHMNRGCELIGAALGDLLRAASGRVIFLDHPLQRRYQDVQAALGHAYLVPDPLARFVGGTSLGATKLEIVL